MMWLLFGIGAIAAAVGNVVFALRQKEASWFRFCSMALTALTVCACYHDAAQQVLCEDWAGLMDVMPTVSWMLWVCVMGSVLINGLSLVLEGKVRKQ